jgi:hypothetical protein
MSEKATGYDWRKSSIFTLRHAAGCAKYTTIKEKKQKKRKLSPQPRMVLLRQVNTDDTQQIL